MKAFHKTGIAAFSLILASVAGLAGCSGGTAKPQGDGAGKTDAAGGKPKDRVEITFWHVWTDKDAGPITARVDAFNKSQDRITVKVLGN